MSLLDLIFPKLCVGCSKFQTYLCPDCLKKINFIDRPICPICESPSPYGLTHPRCQTPLCLNGMFVLAHYKFPLSRAIQKFKYKYVSDLTATLANLLIEKLSSWPILSPNFPLPTSQSSSKGRSACGRSFSPPISHFLIIPVPLHKSRLKWRGFNQSELLAQKLSAYFNLPIDTKSLVRIKKTTPQAKLKTEKERKENLQNAFSCPNKENITGKTIFLVDDLSTTGETIKEAAKVLKRNGAEKVYGLVLARGRS